MKKIDLKCKHCENDEEFFIKERYSGTCKEHASTDEQKAEGVMDAPDQNSVRELLIFAGIPTTTEIKPRAEALAKIAANAGAEAAMIGGAPYLMSALEASLKDRGIKPLYAFSVRESIETVQPDGSLVKTNLFHHAGWVEV